MSFSVSILVRHQILCFSLVWVAYAATYLLRKPLGVVKADLGSELNASKAALGWCDTALILPYAAIQILFPSLADRFGARRVLSVCLGLAAISTVLTYTATDLPTFCLCLALTGGLLAPAWPACTKLLGIWFQDNRLNSIFGLINTATYSGGLGGTALAAALTEYSGWRSVGLPPAILSLITALLLALCVKTPQDTGVTVPGKASVPMKETEATVQPPLMELARLPCVVELGASMFCLKFVRYCIYMWLPLYLLEHLGYTKLQAGLFSTVFDLGGILGSPLLGLALDRMYPGVPLVGVSLVMLTGTAAMALFILTANMGMLANLTFLLVVGAANCGPDSILAGSVSMDVGERGGGGKGAGVTSLVNGVGNLGGMVEGPLVGLLWGFMGWDGVLPLLVVISSVGTVATYRASRMEARRIMELPS